MEMMPQNANQLTFRRDRASGRATCPPAISVGPVHVIHPRFPSVASVGARAEQRAVHERRAAGFTFNAAFFPKLRHNDGGLTSKETGKGADRDRCAKNEPFLEQWRVKGKAMEKFGLVSSVFEDGHSEWPSEKRKTERPLDLVFA